MNELIKHAKAAIKSNPSNRSEIIEIVHLAKAEIEGGGSIDHEVELAISEIDSLSN